jgi:AraC-like DNA-binding protein
MLSKDIFTGFHEAYREKEDEPFVVSRIDAFSYPPHFHFSYELIFIEEGEMRVHINGHSHTLGSGDIAVITPGDVHRLEKTGSAKGAVLIFGERNFSDFNLIFSDYALESSVLHYPEARIDDFIKKVQALRDNRLIAICFKGYINTLFCEFLTRNSLLSKTSVQNNNTIIKALAHISRKFDSGINLEITARQLGVSRSYLSTAFKKMVGCNFNEYINIIRVEKSKRLLRDSVAPIEDIGMECGFSNQRTFDRVFKKIADVTPKEYRMQAHSALK